MGAMLVGLVAGGLGISLLPVSSLHRVPRSLEFIKIPAKTNLCVIWRESDENEALKNFLAIVRKFAMDQEASAQPK